MTKMSVPGVEQTFRTFVRLEQTFGTFVLLDNGLGHQVSRAHAHAHLFKWELGSTTVPRQEAASSPHRGDVEKNVPEPVQPH